MTSLASGEEWVNFSNPYPIYSAIPLESDYMYATEGGIHYTGENKNMLYTSANGLGASSFYALAQSNQYVFAVSKYGLVAAFDKSNGRWKELNRSFLNVKVPVVPDQVALAEPILAVAFEDRLAFFDIDKAAYILTIDKVGRRKLSVTPPKEIRIHGNKLYVSFDDSLYERTIDWANITGDLHLADPESWVLVSKSKKELGFTWERPKIPESIEHHAPLYNYSLDNVYEIKPVAKGGIVAATSDGFLAYSDGRGWRDPVVAWNGMTSAMDAYNYRMKVLSALNDGLLLFHIWGWGFYLYKDDGYSVYKAFLPQDSNSCLDEVLEDYTVAIGTTIAPDSSGFLVATSAPEKYGLVYISKDGRISCAKKVGSSSIAAAITASVNEETNEWDIYVSTRDGFTASSAGTIDHILVQPPKKNGGRIVASLKKTFDGPEGKSIIDFVVDKTSRSIWMVSTGSIAYMDMGQDTLKLPKSMKGLLGAEYTSIDCDVQGNIWVGTTNQGAYRLAKVKSSKDTLSITHFTTKNGLFSNEIHDLSIDPVLGMAWFAHGKGVTRYTRSDLRDAKNFMTENATVSVKAYPNPFRPKQGQLLTIDNVSESSVVSIYNRGGALVKSFYGSEILGGRAEWDGCDKNGALVAPGVYQYVVKDGSKVEKGKIILIH